MYNNVRRIIRCSFLEMLTLFALLAFFSCDSLFSKNLNSDDGEIVAFTGTVSFTTDFSEGGAMPEQYAAQFARSPGSQNNRSAMPTMPTGGTTVVNATASDGTKIDEKTVSGNSFSLVLASGKTWTVTVSMKNSSNEVILSDSEEFDLTSAGVASHDFMLKPLNTGNGTVSLSFGTLPSTVNSVRIVSMNGSTTSSSWSSWSCSKNGGLSATSVSGGAYEMRLFFSNSDESKGYYTNQTINVFPGMTTNKWVAGRSSGPISSSGVFSVTSSMLMNLPANEFYVDGRSGGDGDDENSGTIFYPLKTVKQAVANIVSKSNSTANYVIYVRAGSLEEVSSPITITKNITIECWQNRAGDKNGTAMLKWTGETENQTMFTVQSGKTFTIEGNRSSDANPTWSGLILDGNKNGDDGTADTDDDKKARGVNVSSGSFVLKGGTIQNFCYSPNSSAWGAAVCCSSSDSSIVMYGGTISLNEINNYGGGIYISSGNFTMYDGLVSENSASYKGGGVYVGGGTFTMNGGKISENSTTGSSGGGSGVSVGNGSFIMNGGSINGNTSSDRGGGVYLDGTNAKFIMGGGVIADNVSKCGGGVSMTNGIMYMYGSAVIGDADATEAATAENYSNKAQTGGGIFTEGLSSKVYIGYSAPASGESEPVPDTSFSGGIYYNYATKTGTGEAGAGGIFTKGSSSSDPPEFKMAAGNIKYNGTAGYGGAINIYQHFFEMSGGVIAGNAAGSRGKAVYFDSSGVSFNMSGSAYVASDNDIYLPNGKTLKIAGELTPPEEAGGISATITPINYPSNSTVVEKADGVSDDVFADAISKIAVTPYNSTNYTIDSEGKVVAQ